MTFKDKLVAEYIVPMDISVFGGDDLEDAPVADINTLIETCVDELSSDIVVSNHIEATGIKTMLPKDTIAVSSAKLSYSFQGNRFVKYTFNQVDKSVNLRYYPAVISYRRKLRTEDLIDLRGDQLRFTKSYILWKMASKELLLLKSVDLKTDNASVNVSVLEDFMKECKKTYEDLKPEILLYASSF